MVDVTESATKQIAEYFRDKEVMPIRIFLNQGGWAGPGLAMALDELKENDIQYDIDGFTYVVDKEFLDMAKPIKVDFLVHGFKLDCGIDFGASACGSCSTKSDSCC